MKHSINPLDLSRPEPPNNLELADEIGSVRNEVANLTKHLASLREQVSELRGRVEELESDK